MHLILTGATGLVGSAVLDAMLEMQAVSRISILSRRPVPMAEGKPKAKVILRDDFNKYDGELLEELKGAQGCVWALGISQTQVSAEQYKVITKDYTLSAIQAFTALPSSSPTSQFNFVYVSGEGATQSPSVFTPIFGRVKGETETALLETAAKETPPKLNVYNARPAMVDPYGHTAIEKYLPKSMMKKCVGSVVRTVASSSMVSPTAELGRVLAALAAGDGKPVDVPGAEHGGRTLPNKVLRKLGAA